METKPASEVVARTAFDVALERDDLRRAVLAWLPTCPTCGGTGTGSSLLKNSTCPTCGPLRKVVGK